MDARTWQSAKQLLADVVDLSPAEQRACVEQRCADPELRRQLLQMLDAPAPLSNVVAGALMLAPGTRLGPYEIVARIGGGGMGEVYKARDTRLSRDVAIKILPLHVADDSDRRARFEREAHTISRLNHPHICTLYDVGEQDGVTYLVMELIDGETLADRLQRGALPIEQALTCGIQIASALDRAHRQGIVHRDLKPANVMLTKSGAKLLDFGLARLVAKTVAVDDRAMSVTVTGPRTILGTPGYMAPEQIEGRDVDARADIFALGVVLHEMFTGGRPFHGESDAALMGAILRDRPDPLPPQLPRPITRAVATCLEKDPDARPQSAADLARALQWATEDSGEAASSGKGTAWRRWLLAALGVGLAVVSAAWVATMSSGRPAMNAPVTFTFEPPAMLNPNMFAISPDGSMVVLSGVTDAGARRLFLRMLSGTGIVELPGTDGAFHPFWSPDGRFIAFGTASDVKVISVSRRDLRTLCRIPSGWGGTWNANGTIVFAGNDGGQTILFKIPAEGGNPVPLTKLDRSAGEIRHAYPQFLPDGRTYLYLSSNANEERSAVWAAFLDGKDKRQVLPLASNVAFAAPDMLLFHRGAALMVQHFDLASLRLTGTPAEIADHLSYNPSTARAGFDVARDGTLVYRAAASGVQLSWRGRDGTRQSTLDIAADAAGVRLAPDGGRLAFTAAGGNAGNLWTFDVRAKTPMMLTSTQADHWPAWSPDGSRIAFDTVRKDGHVLYEIASDGARAARVLVPPEDGFSYGLLDWSPHALIYHASTRPDGGPRRSEIRFLPASGIGPSSLYFQTDQEISHGQLSPDGRWFAYGVIEPNAAQVFVRPFPDLRNRRWPVSAQSGRYPRWSHDGRELFYFDAGHRQLMSAAITPGKEFRVASTKKLFDVSMRLYKGGPDYPYDVSPDGQHFLVFDDGVTPHNAPITVVLHWQPPLGRQR